MSENKLEIEPCYYDECGNEIREGDLIRVWHFRSYKNTIEYMYHIVLLQESQGKYYWSAKEHHKEGNKGHYWLKTVGNNENRIIKGTTVLDRDPTKTPNHFNEILRKHPKKQLVKL